MRAFHFLIDRGPAIKVNGPEFEIFSFPFLTDLLCHYLFLPFALAAFIKDENNG